MRCDASGRHATHPGRVAGGHERPTARRNREPSFSEVHTYRDASSCSRWIIMINASSRLAVRLVTGVQIVEIEIQVKLLYVIV